ncbi:MAG: hypothetical protein IKJ01_05410 [Lachnospiraceae bacterium]|nr:hypothetical protein [Lachnospiraceae bacterium]
MNKEHLQIALQLARMYGVAETLNPMKQMDSNSFVTMILEWTDNYIKSNETDIVEYFNKLF